MKLSFIFHLFPLFCLMTPKLDKSSSLFDISKVTYLIYGLPVNAAAIQTNKSLQDESRTKLIKELNEEELCAYKILKKIIETESVDKGKIVFFSKVQIRKKGGLLEINTKAKTQLKYFKSPSGATILSYSLVLKNKVENKMILPKDSVIIKKFISYTPKYETGTKAACYRFEWEIYNKGSQYLGSQYSLGNTVNTDYFVKNEKDFQGVDYVDNAYAIVKNNNKYGVLDRNSKTLLPIKFNFIIKNEFGLLINDNNIYYYFDPITGKKLSNSYSEVNVYAMYNLKQKLFPVKRNGKMTLLNSKFEEITPLLYDSFSIRGFGENKILIGRTGGKWVVIDSENGKVLREYLNG